jgi:hypothetical protein
MTYRELRDAIDRMDAKWLDSEVLFVEPYDEGSVLSVSALGALGEAAEYAEPDKGREHPAIY